MVAGSGIEPLHPAHEAGRRQPVSQPAIFSNNSIIRLNFLSKFNKAWTINLPIELCCMQCISHSYSWERFKGASSPSCPFTNSRFIFYSFVFHNHILIYIFFTANGGNSRLCSDANNSGDCHAAITLYSQWCCVGDLNSRYSSRKPDIIAKLDQRSMAALSGIEPEVLPRQDRMLPLHHRAMVQEMISHSTCMAGW